MMAFRLILKVQFTLISSLIQGSFRQLAMDYKIGMRLILVFTDWVIGYLVNFPFHKYQVLRKEKMDKFVANEKNLKILPQIPWLKFQNPSIKFAHGTNLKVLYLVLSDWRVKSISLLRCFCESFIFLVLLKQISNYGKFICNVFG